MSFSNNMNNTPEKWGGGVNKPLHAPFAWIGGKSKLAAQIIPLMAPHQKYIEVFGGALSVFYRKEPSKIEILNDINGDLINLHRIIQTRPQSLNSCLNGLLRSREIFYAIKHRTIKPRNKIEAAAFFYFQIAASFGAKGEHFAMPKGRGAKNIYRDFRVYSRRLRRATIENLSYEKLIKEYDSEDSLFYLDPPYVGTENYYKTAGGFSRQDHQALAEILRGIKGKFMLSYNDCEPIRDLYRGFNMKELKISYSLNNAAERKSSSELLIMNY